ncbi:RNA polymerase sigma-70 factor (ECF subfamily) [Silvibacterium bohemicum]|uniref:RNA polymerase sigma-70 factor (ECF subfamily) n=1 Tax=Silvibacterium bohemicum TaxID=1577686 RepID=A0A841JWU3_9BACT|nr:RNA polymerase sigma factor [Silvibacterium bohemicum]MBB6145873.1 RNA polymerase sigma-70 factor (ECF subfamily) [Silvibacterium bohemicum]
MNLADEVAEINIASRNDESLRLERLVTAAQSGSSAAFTEIREICSPRIYRKVFTITKNREDAEDAMQDAFLRAYKALHTFEGRSSFRSWFTRIAINSALMILRKRRNHREVSFDFPNEIEGIVSSLEFEDDSPSPEHICVHRQRCDRVLRLVGKLQPCLRQIVEMQMMQHRTIKQIAHELEISEAAVKSRLYRARLRLAPARMAEGVRRNALCRNMQLGSAGKKFKR